MKVRSDNRIDIGNKNKINNSIIGNNIDINNKYEQDREKKDLWYSKVFWKVLVPVFVTVIGAFILWKLGIGRG